MQTAIKMCCRPKDSEDRSSTDTNTIDDKEVALFSRHADEWWNETGEFATLHSLNELRVPLVRDKLLAQNVSSDDTGAFKPKPLAGFNILDVGCGGGILSEVCTIMLTYQSCCYQTSSVLINNDN